MELNPTNPEEGIYFNVPEPIYRKAKGYSQTQVKQTEYSMAHFHEAVTGPPKKPTKDQITGTLLHGLVLQKKELWVVVPEDAPNKPTKKQLSAAKPSPATVEAIMWWKQFRARNEGKEFIDQEFANELYRMRDSIMRHPEAAEMLGRSTGFEVAAFKKHSTGLLIKGLADCLCTDDNEMTVVPDIKTTQEGGASMFEFRNSIVNWGYYRQAAFYLDLFGASFFLFIAVEKEPPYAVACYLADHDMIVQGRRENERDLARIAECEKTGVWPAYPSGIHSIGLPEWKKKQMLLMDAVSAPMDRVRGL